MAKCPKFTKFISVLLTITFLASQAYADPRPSPATEDNLAPSVVSDGNINTGRSDAARGDIAKGTEPGAIGNGRPLVELMQGILPDIAVAENADARIAKIKDAISYALTRATQNSSYVPDQYKARVEYAIKTLKDMLDRPADLAKIHFFNARVLGDEDYLLGFNYEGKIGLAVELIDSLPLDLLAQYIFHEVIPEKGLITERQDHRNIYQDVQTAIFGLNDVLDLKKALRALINEKLGQTEAEWPNPANLPGESLNLLPGEEPAGPALPKALAAEIVTEEIAKATATISTHLTLNAKGELDMGGIVIVMKKDLPESLAGKKEGMVDGAVKQEYKVMKQHLRKLFAKGVFEVEKAEDLVPQMNALISQGLKVVVLDDGTLTKGLDPAAIQGKAVENYCVVAADKVKAEENLILPFINLNAMAMVGVGVLYRDPNLIGMAYKAFTGNEPPMDLVNDLMNKAVWIIKMLPRIVKFKDELRVQEQLRRMVAASA